MSSSEAPWVSDKKEGCKVLDPSADSPSSAPLKSLPHLSRLASATQRIKQQETQIRRETVSQYGFRPQGHKVWIEKYRTVSRKEDAYHVTQAHEITTRGAHCCNAPFMHGNYRYLFEMS